MNALPEEGMVTVAEAAACFRVSKMTIYRLVHAGEVSSIRVGRSIRIPARELAEKFTPTTAGENADGVRLSTLTIEQGQVELTVVPPRQLARNLVTASRHLLGDAGNYVEFAFPARDSGERFVLTVQRVGAGFLTPHEAREAAETARDQLAEALAVMREERDRALALIAEYDDADAPLEELWRMRNVRDALHGVTEPIHTGKSLAAEGRQGAKTHG